MKTLFWVIALSCLWLSVACGGYDPTDAEIQQRIRELAGGVRAADFTLEVCGEMRMDYEKKFGDEEERVLDRSAPNKEQWAFLDEAEKRMNYVLDNRDKYC